MPYSAHSQTTQLKICPAVLAGMRIIQALKSWERELRLEIYPNLGKIVDPLTTAFVESKRKLMEADLTTAMSCRQQFQKVVEILQGVDHGVTAPWNEDRTELADWRAMLSRKWKDSNPLSHMRDDIELLESALNAMSNKQVSHTCHNCVLLNSAAQ